MRWLIGLAVLPVVAGCAATVERPAGFSPFAGKAAQPGPADYAYARAASNLQDIQWIHSVVATSEQSIGGKQTLLTFYLSRAAAFQSDPYRLPSESEAWGRMYTGRALALQDEIRTGRQMLSSLSCDEAHLKMSAATEHRRGLQIERGEVPRPTY
jgi:hypothetical protein